MLIVVGFIDLFAPFFEAGAPMDVYERYFIPGLMPYESRLAVGAGTRSDVATEFGHEALTETHDLIIRLPFWIKIGTAFSSAHGQGGEAVLQYLFECQEL